MKSFERIGFDINNTCTARDNRGVPSKNCVITDESLAWKYSGILKIQKPTLFTIFFSGDWSKQKANNLSKSQDNQFHGMKTFRPNETTGERERRGTIKRPKQDYFQDGRCCWLSVEFPCRPSYLAFFPSFRKVVFMALSSTSPPSASSSSLSFLWAGLRSPVFSPKSVRFASAKRTQDNSGKEGTLTENSSFELLVLASKGPVQVPYSEKCSQEKSWGWRLDLAAEDIDEKQQKNLSLCGDKKEQKSHFKVENSLRKDCIFAATEHGERKMVSFGSPAKDKAVEKESYPKVGGKVRKRPARIVIPKSYQSIIYAEEFVDLEEKEFQAEGRDFYVASKRGGRKASEDGYGVVADASGDPKQAFFGVFDGHGGRAAVDYVIDKLGINIITAVGKLEKSDGQIQEAIRAAYLTTDKEFLSQGVCSGVCAATVLLKDGDLHVANVGDCRVVLSRKGVATALTRDHRPDSEDERRRIESSGGYVNYCNGVWRVQGSLAISRAIGDVHLNDWIISEPEIDKLRLTADCEFLIMASDGLWDKVSNQEAVDVVMRHKKSVESCKALVDMSSSRGSMDDITVMVVYLQNFTETYDQLRVF